MDRGLTTRSQLPSQPPPRPKPMARDPHSHDTVPIRSRRNVKRGFAWGTLGAFAIAVVTIAVALSSGNSPSEVEFPGATVKFVGPADAPTTIRQQQDELEQIAEEAEVHARAEPEAAIAAPIDLSGWWDGHNGASYEIGQFGSALVIHEVTTYGITAIGQGSVRMDLVVFDYVAADGSEGVGSFVIEDNSTLMGTFENFTHQSQESATLTR
jgi:hypothetical protein